MENLIFLLSEGWSTTTAADQFFSILRFFGATILVAALAYFATKKLAGSRMMGQRNGNLSVLESINVGGQAVIQLVKAGDKFLVVGVTKENITLLSEIDKEHINEPERPDFKNLNTPFAKVLSRFIQPKGSVVDDE
ncbi:MAG: flagellar biosynthetic protein FliO [Clostridiales bacterium]|jgi:flagellar protein FliO/FliZ|nr:flagellar biosynthetic protein FliO [Clostridiales bacterium]